jgi:MFS transporter, DHA1 family, multidrug resistance protein
VTAAEDAARGTRRDWLRGLPPEVAALAAVAFLVALGFGVVAPAIPLFAREFGVSTAAASAVVSAFAATRLLMAPFAGRLVNQLGERVVLATGIGIVAISSVLAGLAQNYWQLIGLRGVGGAGSAMFTVSSASLLIRVTVPTQRGRAQGLFAGGFLLGSIAGPAIGFVAVWSLRAPFFLYAGTLVGAGTLGLWALRHSVLAARGTTRGEPLPLREALANPAYRAALACAAVEQWSVLGVRLALVPLFVAEVLHRGTGLTYVGFFVLSAVSGVLLLPLGRVADTRGRRPVILLGLLLASAGLALLPFSGPGLLLGCMAVLGVAAAALSVAPAAVVGDVVASRGGTVVATFQMAGDSGVVVGPLVAGWLADAHGFTASFAVAAFLTALPAILVLRAPETLVRESPSRD